MSAHSFPTYGAEEAQPQADETQAKQTRAKKSATAFRTISEVADYLDVQQHVLRFWETKFTQVRPLKRGGGRRYYRPEDVALLKTIHHLLYTEGYTIKGVQKLLKEQGKAQIVQNNKPVQQPDAAVQQERSNGLTQQQRSTLEAMLSDLKELRKLINSGE